ncbi:DUF5677 domain-containing protein [Microbispora bryophytorum]|uniref:DUF5677 domain-containing protein n=1 Tax=Microbispora bryophytorum TaxID=1460882 RepID=UPI0033C58C39
MSDDTFLDVPMLMAGTLNERAPELLRAIEACVAELQPFILFAYSASSAGHAGAVVANQAFNDFIDLCFDLCVCRGRSALREARALFEHLVNFLDVTSDPDLAKRYELHGAVAAQIEAAAKYGHEFLSGNELRGARHVLGKLARESRPDYEMAIANYGLRFRKNWANSTLKDRADRHGLGGEYDFYRLASAVLHGSAGGVKGTLSSQYERPVHRAGPALELSPLAYLKGLEYFRKFILAIAPLGVRGGEKHVVAAIDAALALWPDYRRVMMQMDRDIWPEEGPVQAMAVLGINRSGDRKWFLHDFDTGRIIDAEPPVEGELTEGHKEQVQIILSRLPAPEYRDEWVTVAMLGVRVTPRRGASWRLDTDILQSMAKYQYLGAPYIRGRLQN